MLRAGLQLMASECDHPIYAQRPGRGQAPPVPYTDQVVHRLGYGGACPACPRHSHDSIPT